MEVVSVRAAVDAVMGAALGVILVMVDVVPIHSEMRDKVRVQFCPKWSSPTSVWSIPNGSGPCRDPAQLYSHPCHKNLTTGMCVILAALTSRINLPQQHAQLTGAEPRIGRSTCTTMRRPTLTVGTMCVRKVSTKQCSLSIARLDGEGWRKR
jgi:hypothetical protein